MNDSGESRTILFFISNVADLPFLIILLHLMLSESFDSESSSTNCHDYLDSPDPPSPAPSPPTSPIISAAPTLPVEYSVTRQ